MLRRIIIKMRDGFASFDAWPGDRRFLTAARQQEPTGRRRTTRDEITSLMKALGDVMRYAELAFD